MLTLDVLVTADDIITLDPARPHATRMGIIGDRIVGFDDEVAGLTAERTRHFAGATITPGLIDAHCHTLWYGLGLATIDVAAARHLEELYALIESGAEQAAEHDWVHATGFNQSNFDGAYPDLAVLDRVTGNRPLYLRHTSGHAAIVNTAMLRLVGAFDPDFEHPIGGEFVRDAHGQLTGVVDEAAQSLVQALLLPYSTKQLVQAIDAATRRYAAEGITSFSEAGVGGGWIGHSGIEVAAYQAAAATGKLHARAQLLPAIDALHEIVGSDEDLGGTGRGLGLDLGIAAGFGDDRVRFGHVKVFLDGAISGKTAAVTESFCGHGAQHGYLLDEPANSREQALAAYRSGWPLALHAIGDRAIDLALDIIEEAQETSGPHEHGGTRVPCRIEHFGISRPDQVERAAGLGIAVTPQAGFIEPLGDLMMEYVGPDRAGWLYRGRSLIDAGVILAGSSDLPVADNNLRRGMQSAIDRRTRTGQPHGLAEAITAEEALQTHTVWAARATGQLNDKGTLARGKLADFTVFSGSPLTAPDLRELEIIATFVGGVQTHGASSDSR